MPVLSQDSTFANWTRTSNYEGNQTLQVLLRQKTVEGSGVQKTPGFKSLRGAARAKPGPSYWKEWTWENRGSWGQNHTETGPGGSPFLYSYKQGPYTTSLSPSNMVLPESLVEAHYKATTTLLREMKGEGANIANMFAERRQTVKSIENIVNILVYTVRDLRRGRIKSAIRRMGGDPLTANQLRKKDIADQWLSLQYGWKPLLKDVYDLVNGAHNRELTDPRVFRVSGKAKMSRPSDSSWAFDPWKGKNWGTRTTSAVYRYTVRAFPDIALAEPAALGLTNPLVVAWEVTPWSFVVDWFFPVGRYFEQLSADHGWLFHDGSVSTLEKSREEAAFYLSDSYTSSGWSYTNVWWLRAGQERVTFRRNPMTGFPSAPRIRFKNPFSAAHLANSLALLTQVFSGPGRRIVPYDR